MMFERVNLRIFVRVALLLTLLAFAACTKEKPDAPEPEQPSVELPPWNKENTATIYVVSQLEDAALPLSPLEYKELGELLASKGFHAAFLDRCDVEHTNPDIINGGVICAFAARRELAYALRRCDAVRYEGMAVLVDSVALQAQSLLGKGLRLTSVPATINSKLPLPLSVLFLQNDAQVKVLATSLSTIYAAKQVIVGTVPQGLYAALEEEVKRYGANLRLERIEEEGVSTSNSLFLLMPKFWVLRECTVEKFGSHGVPVYCLQVEANVFY